MGISTVRDRVAQTAAKLVVEPIFEADFEPSGYGYRPRRSAEDAVREVHRGLCEGYTEVVDADLAKYFDTIRTTSCAVAGAVDCGSSDAQPHQGVAQSGSGET